MANEIKALDGDGQNTYRVLFLYPIASPKQIGSPLANVVVTPSSNLNQDPIAAVVTSATEKAALDAGTMAYEVITFSNAEGLTNPQLATRLREIYAARIATFQTQYTDRFRYTGQSLNP